MDRPRARGMVVHIGTGPWAMTFAPQLYHVAATGAVGAVALLQATESAGCHTWRLLAIFLLGMMLPAPYRRRLNEAVTPTEDDKP